LSVPVTESSRDYALKQARAIAIVLLTCGPLPGTLDREIDVIMLVMPDPWLCFHERQRLETLTCRCG